MHDNYFENFGIFGVYFAILSLVHDVYCINL